MRPFNTQVEEMDDEGVTAVAAGLPPSLTSLDLSFIQCFRVRDAGVQALAKCAVWHTDTRSRV